MLDAKTVKLINENTKKNLDDPSLAEIAAHKIYRKATKKKNDHYQCSVTFVEIENFSESEIDEAIEKLSDAGYDAEREVIEGEHTGFMKVEW